MISVEDFESGKVKLTDEMFRPVFNMPLPPKEVRHLFPVRLLGYEGVKTGTILSPEFSEVLEP